MHIRFDTEVSAARALAKNGQTVDGNMMIGVAAYDSARHTVCNIAFQCRVYIVTFALLIFIRMVLFITDWNMLNRASGWQHYRLPL